jgi:hypothetical protein
MCFSELNTPLTQSPILISADHVSKCDNPATIIFYDSVGCTISAEANVAGWGEVAYKNCKQPAYLMVCAINLSILHITAELSALIASASTASVHTLHSSELYCCAAVLAHALLRVQLQLHCLTPAAL